MEININDFLSKEELKDIVIGTFKEHVSNKLKEHNISDLLSNVSYSCLFNKILEEYPEAEETLKENFKKVINDESSVKYELYRDKTFSHEEGPGLTLLKRIVAEEKPNITNRVKKELEEYPLKELLQDTFKEQISTIANKYYNIGDYLYSLINKD